MAPEAVQLKTGMGVRLNANRVRAAEDLQDHGDDHGDSHACKQPDPFAGEAAPARALKDLVVTRGPILGAVSGRARTSQPVMSTMNTHRLCHRALYGPRSLLRSLTAQAKSQS
jgi:hypothetical protein